MTTQGSGCPDSATFTPAPKEPQLVQLLYLVLERLELLLAPLGQLAQLLHRHAPKLLPQDHVRPRNDAGVRVHSQALHVL